MICFQLPFSQHNSRCTSLKDPFKGNSQQSTGFEPTTSGSSDVCTTAVLRQLSHGEKSIWVVMKKLGPTDVAYPGQLLELCSVFTVYHWAFNCSISPIMVPSPNWAYHLISFRAPLSSSHILCAFIRLDKYLHHEMNSRWNSEAIRKPENGFYLIKQTSGEINLLVQTVKPTQTE